MIANSPPLTAKDLDAIRAAVTADGPPDPEYLRRAALWLLDDNERLRLELGAANQSCGVLQRAFEEVRAQRDESAARIRNARAEIRSQDIGSASSNLTIAQQGAVSDALAEVETHLVDPQYRPDPADDAKRAGQHAAADAIQDGGA